MNVEFNFDGHFSTEQHLELSKKECFIKWEISTLPIKGDFIELENFKKDMPDFCKDGYWRVEHRTFVNKERIRLYLMYTD